MKHIYHIADHASWTAAQFTRYYSHPSLATEGFIHCSTAAQLEATANRYFSNSSEILVLVIDTEKVTSPIRYELATAGEEFPHIYGALNTDAVVDEKQFIKESGGRYSLTM